MRVTGQILRIVGLLIEMLGILVFALRTRTGMSIPSVFERVPINLIWVVVGLGFATWLVGSILTYWPRTARVVRKPNGRDEKLLKL
jgi:hypothetical protein